MENLGEVDCVISYSLFHSEATNILSSNMSTNSTMSRTAKIPISSMTESLRGVNITVTFREDGHEKTDSLKNIVSSMPTVSSANKAWRTTG